MAPIALPAGGAIDITDTEIRRSLSFSQLITCENYFLKASPLDNAPILREIDKGTTLRIVRNWSDEDGQIWMQVQISNFDILDNLEAGRRGWIII